MIPTFHETSALVEIDSSVDLPMCFLLPFVSDQNIDILFVPSGILSHSEEGPIILCAQSFLAVSYCESSVDAFYPLWRIVLQDTRHRLLTCGLPIMGEG